MTGLLRAEVLRLTSRRLLRVLTLVFLGILLLVHVVNAVRSHPLTAAERAENAEQRQVCEQMKERGEIPEEVSCAGFGVRDPLFSAADVLPETRGAVAGAAAMIAFIVGASAVGAEWAAGTMQALLFWEPRRGRVLLAKGLAVVGVMAALTLVMYVVGFGLTMLVGATRGTTGGVTAALVGDEVVAALRGLVVVAFAGLLGFAVAGLARVTGAALGAGFVYFAIVEQIIAGLRPGWIGYLIAPNMAAVFTGRVGIEDDRFSISAAHGVLVLVVYLAVALGAFYAVFTRRDVT